MKVREIAQHFRHWKSLVCGGVFEITNEIRLHGVSADSRLISLSLFGYFHCPAVRVIPHESDSGVGAAMKPGGTDDK